MRKDYPYNEALDDLTSFFKKHIKDEKTLTNLLNIIDRCRERKTVALKGIYYDYINYVKEFDDNSQDTLEEKKCGMIFSIFGNDRQDESRLPV